MSRMHTAIVVVFLGVFADIATVLNWRRLLSKLDTLLPERGHLVLGSGLEFCGSSILCGCWL